MELELDSGLGSLAAVYVAALLNVTVPCRMDSAPSSGAELRPRLGSAVGLMAVAEQLAERAGPSGSSVLGQSVAPEVDSWVSFALRESRLPEGLLVREASTRMAALNKLNQCLLPHVFVTGHTVTVADVALYVALHPHVKAMNDVDRSSVPAVTRWFDHMQHLPEWKRVALNVAHFRVAPLDLVPIRPVVVLPDEKKSATASSDKAPVKNNSAPNASEKVHNTNNKTSSTSASNSTPNAKSKGNVTQKKESSVEEDPAANAVERKDGGGGKEGKPDAATIAARREAAAAAKKEKAAVKKEKTAAAPAAAAAEEEDKPAVARLDIRVGQIVKVFVNPNADGLYVEEIELGEAKPRQVVSGLAKFVPIEAMQGAKVLVLCNLKPSKLRGYNSEAMVLAASNADHTQVELVVPPAGCSPGDRVTFEGYGHFTPDSVLNPKKKYFETVKPSLVSTAERVAVFMDGEKALPFTTSQGPCTVPSLTHASIG